MTFFSSRLPGGDRDRGVALVTVMLAVLVILGFTATVAAVSIDNIGNAHNDRQSGSALGAADAGIAQAIEYIRNNGVSGFTCPDASQLTCTLQNPGYASPSSPKALAFGDGATGCTTSPMNCAKVYVTAVDPFNPPDVTTGTYAVHSRGYYGAGPGIRSLVVTLKVTPDTFPVGVFGQRVSANGNTAIYTESLFTQGCVYPLQTGNGNGLEFQGIDAYWDQPASAHSTVGLSTSNNSTCSTTDRGPVPPGPASATPSDANCYDGSSSSPRHLANLDADQSLTGGPVGPSTGQGSACYRIYPTGAPRADGTYYPSGSCPSGVTPDYSNGLCDTTSFTLTDLQRYGYRPRGLSDSQYAELRARAQASNTYNLSAGQISGALATAMSNGTLDPVLYWDCNVGSACSGGNVKLKVSNFPNLYTSGPSATCSGSLPVVTIVVEHTSGTLTLSGGNSWINAAIFVPDGTYDGNGGANIFGTLFANTVSMGGNQLFELNNCWVTSFPGAILDVTQTSFREDDATDLQ